MKMAHGPGPCNLGPLDGRATEPTRAPGGWVRFVPAVGSRAPLTGSCVAQRWDTLALEVAGRPGAFAVPFTAIRRPEASRGGHSNMLTGLLVALGVGGA